jgi:hypothetical protein
MAKKVRIDNAPAGRPALVVKPMMDWLGDFANALIEWMERNGHVASGDTIDSMVVTYTLKPAEVFLIADDSLIYAIQGREKGKLPNIGRISDWIQDKGLTYDGGAKGLLGLAIAISKKIAKEGTSPPKMTLQQVESILLALGRKHTEQLGRNLMKEASNEMINFFDKSKKFKQK